MPQLFPEEKSVVPSVDFMFRKDGEFVTRSSEELFNGKKVVLFALPGAFTPTCSAYQLPGYEEKYYEFKEAGIDEIYCLSVNDAFVMNAWAKDQMISNVKLIPDGNGEFTSAMGMLVQKFNLGFAMRSWRYAAVINDGVIEQIFMEDGKEDNASEDPYEWSTPEKLLEYVKTSTPAVVV
jgi:thioredoxin-dependent peroxiredoxin